LIRRSFGISPSMGFVIFVSLLKSIGFQLYQGFREKT
jgi:hypothetical protein